MSPEEATKRVDKILADAMAGKYTAPKSQEYLDLLRFTKFCVNNPHLSLGGSNIGDVLSTLRWHCETTEDIEEEFKKLYDAYESLKQNQAWEGKV